MQSVPYAFFAENGITPAQALAIEENTKKSGTSPELIAAIEVNTEKVGITTDQADAITANTAKTGITAEQASAITANTAAIDFLDGVSSNVQTQLDGKQDALTAGSGITISSGTISASRWCNFAFKILCFIFLVLSILPKSSEISTDVVPTKTGLPSFVRFTISSMTALYFSLLVL